MKPYERRQKEAYPYFRLATWNSRLCVWHEGRAVFEMEAAARNSASRPGRYRISRIDENGRTDLEPFDVN